MTPHEELMDRTLRWMRENLMGAYTAVHPAGHPQAGQPCTNSGTCVLVCCYMNALGKVLLKGGPHRGARRDFGRFHAFLERCMPDFLTESARKSLPSPPGRRNGGEALLYDVYRCGFVHGFYPSPGFAWGRRPRLQAYWWQHEDDWVLNIDELVRGFQRGMNQFRQIAQADPNLRRRFKDYLLA
jgi:hypothetical protein